MDNFEETKPESNQPESNQPEQAAPFSQEPEVATLVITEDIRSYIYETAKWTKFLSIVGFIFSGLMVIAAFGVGAVMSSVGNELGPGLNMLGKMGGGFFTVLYLVFALFYFYPSLLLFKYANAAKAAILFSDQASLSIAMSKMKSLFKFWGIFTIIIIGFYALAIVIVGIVGAGAALGR
jgi:hypothetical protein